MFGDIPAGGSCAMSSVVCTAGTPTLSAGVWSHLTVEQFTPGGIHNQKLLLKSCAGTLGGIVKDNYLTLRLYLLLLSSLWCCWPYSTLCNFFLLWLGCCLGRLQPLPVATDSIPTVPGEPLLHSQETGQWLGSFTGSFCSPFSSVVSDCWVRTVPCVFRGCNNVCSK